MIHTTTAARIARILAEHPRCVAWGTSIGHAYRSTSTDRERLAVLVLRAWLLLRGPRIAEVTLDESLDDVAVRFAVIGAIPVILFTVLESRPNEPTFYVAIEFNPEAS